MVIISCLKIRRMPINQKALLELTSKVELLIKSLVKAEGKVPVSKAHN